MTDVSIYSEFADDPEFQELLTMFMESMAEQQTHLNDAFMAGDLDQVREVSHKIKGSGAGYGFPELTDLAASLEVSSRERLDDRVETDFNALQDYLNRLLAGT
ncbi:Hpt domain-containing protein [Thalassoroseus pseudoceratinae]|uniref:Hpt domain-containing protein n=1 Tax=Thalassoroseus pseudoceratinae TaxID=2713176 RepID=UPI001423D448|nr:Hpt domain-containing protein [Thalassoroseus pseudoceratinae]